MPTGEEMYRILNALDLTYKCEIILVSNPAKLISCCVVSTPLDHILDKSVGDLHLYHAVDGVLRRTCQAWLDLAHGVPSSTRGDRLHSAQIPAKVA